jgi:hypothetical protein
MIGSITGTIEATVDMKVRKHGRTSGHTEGEVTDIEYDAIVGMDHQDTSIIALFNDQVRIEAIVRRGIPVVGNEDAVLCRGPVEYGGISCAFGKGVLNSHEVDLGQAAEETADDGTVDIGITGQPQHPSSPRCCGVPAAHPD